MAMDLRQAVTEALKLALGEHARKWAILRECFLTPKTRNGGYGVWLFPFGAIAKKAPVDIAKELAPQIKVGGLIQRAEAMGPFINFFAAPAKLLDWATESVLTERFFVKLTLQSLGG